MQIVTIGAYVLAVLLCMQHEDAPRWVWMIALPIMPLFVVIFGFHAWRRVCPLARIGALGRRWARARRRIPRWMDRNGFLIAFAFLFLGLVLRHVVFNGDHDGIGCALLVVALAAVLVNYVFPGKTWCHVVCPVGVVERIYADGGTLRGATKNTACEPCTGCKSRCADIDASKSYRADLTAPARRIATFALPGLVLAFYAYYRLRHGEWEAFFDGRWADTPCDHALIFGPGFAFAPHVPAIAAVAMTLVVGATMSFAIFATVEQALVRRGIDPTLLRHRMLAVASFVAFNLFYQFAGQPTLRHVPVLDRLVAFVVPVLSTLVLARRWSNPPAGGAARARRLPVLSPTDKGRPDVPR